MLKVYPEQSNRIIVPCPLTTTAASRKTLTTSADFFRELVKHIKTLVFVRRNFLKSFMSEMLSITAPFVLDLAR